MIAAAERSPPLPPFPMKTTLFSTLCLAAILSSVSAADGPSVTLVTDPNAAPLETHAAKELTGLLTTLFDARVTIAKGNPPEGATRVIRLGAAQSAGALTADLGQQGRQVNPLGSRHRREQPRRDPLGRL